MKYVGNKEHALNAAIDHVAFMRLVKIKAADDGLAGLCCVTFFFGDDTQVPEKAKYPAKEPRWGESLAPTKEIQIPKQKDISTITFERSKQDWCTADADKKGHGTYKNEWVGLASIELKDAAGNSLGSMKSSY